MIKSNTKKAKENILKYVLGATADYFEIDCNMHVDEVSVYPEIWRAFMRQKDPASRRTSLQSVFYEWATGLAMGGLFDYFAPCDGNTATAILAEILEETPEEAGRYTDDQAEKTLTALIYREVYNNKDR